MIYFDFITFNKIRFTATTAEEVAVVKWALTYEVKGAWFIKKMWGSASGEEKFYDPKTNTFYSGILEDTCKRLTRKKWEFKITAKPLQEVDWLTFSEHLLSEERSYQREAIQTFFQHLNGIIKVPTRGGKTVIASEIIRLNLQRKPDDWVIFIVDSTDLFKQTVNELSKFIGVPKSEIGIISGEKRIIKQINVAMIQTLVSSIYPKPLEKRRKKDSEGNERPLTLIEKKKLRPILARKRREMTEFLSVIDFLIVDEIQEFGAEKRDKVLKKCVNISKHLSLSATPYKSEDKNATLRLKAFAGEIIYEIPEQKLVDAGVLSKSKVLVILYNHNVDDDDIMTEYHAGLIDEYVTHNEERNEFIKQCIEVFNELRLKALVLFSSKKHGYKISEESGEFFISGDDDNFTREESKAKFLAGKAGVLLASDIYKKGITLPEAQIMFNVNGGKETSLIIQRRGRILGTTEDKKRALTIDIFDEKISYLSDHCLLRLRAYEKQCGVGEIDVLDVQDVDFSIKFKKYLKEWFNGKE